MSFSWSIFSGFHLLLDGFIVATFLAFFYFLRRWGPWVSLSGSWTAAVLLWGLVGSRTMGFFFLARLLWTVSSVALPLGMAYWWRRSGGKLWGVGALLLSLFKVYGEVVEPRHLEVTRITFRSAKVRKPIRITHVSDIQTDGLTGMYKRVKEASDSFDPHLVVFTGDLANHPTVLPEVESYLKSFKRREGSFMVGGNVDVGLDLDAVAGRAGFENVEGRTKRFIVEEIPVAMMGVGIGEAHHRSLLRALLAKTEPGDLVLLLSHYPDALFTAQREPVDLLLAGHTHGGQVCLPWFGPVVTLSSVPRKVAAGGLHKVGDVWALVSRGLGWEGHVAPRVRTFCRPQVILLELLPAAGKETL